VAAPAAAASRTAAAASATRWAAWDRFLEATPATGFMQSSWWADLRTTVGFTHFAAILKDSGGIVGGAMVQRLRHRSGVVFYYIQDGPVLPGDPSLAEDVLEATLGDIEERRASEREPVSHLRIEPRRERAEYAAEGRSGVVLPGFEPVAHKDRYVEPRDTLCVDLRPEHADILAAMKPKGRYNISVARRHGVAIVEDTSPRGLADFLRIYRDTAGRQGFRTKPASYFESLIGVAAPRRRASIHLAEHAGTRLAAALVIRFGPRATYFYGGSLDLRRHVMAPYLLHFDIMCQAKQAGHEWYDLWGVAPEADEKHAWAGISVLKRRFGGREVRLVPTLDYVYDRSAYMRYQASEAAGRPRRS
jgi:lipid II:glycine glycyltransferase (peptidoglycan interpeptide bridge formation enzyme)